MRAPFALAASIAASAFFASAAADTVWSTAPRTSRWSTEWSPDVPRAQAPSAASGIGSPRSTSCTPGEPRWVLSIGSWYAATIVAGPDAQGRCLVSYDGFGAGHDEWVGPERIAERQPSAAAPPSGSDRNQGPRNDSAGGVPAGTYQCYTFDVGQLNYAYTDIVVTAADAYAVGAQHGIYRLADGALSFTGPLANARGRYAVKRGRPVIDLIFDGDSRSSMSCTKSR